MPHIALKNRKIAGICVVDKLLLHSYRKSNVISIFLHLWSFQMTKGVNEKRCKKNNTYTLTSIILYFSMAQVENTILAKTCTKQGLNPVKTYICGCVRNCAKYLPAVLKNIKNIGELFDDYQIVIAYDYSTDPSLIILQQMKEQFFPTMEIILGPMEELTGIRTQNICNARNRILDYVQNDATTENRGDYEYMIMMDMDDVCSGRMNLDLLQKHVDQERMECADTRNIDPWDALSFNRKEYYDIWALSLDPYMFSCWNFTNAKRVVKETQKYVEEKLEILLKENSDGLLSCASAFNGFAIYRLKAFTGVRYEWNINKSILLFSKEILDKNCKIVGGQIRKTVDQNDCEHRYFHMRATERNGARICISPQCLFLDYVSNGVMINMNERSKQGTFLFV